MVQAESTPFVSADDEWSPLKAVIVGRAEHSAFPSEPAHMITATMPAEHRVHFRPQHRFPADILAKAQAELDGFAALLERLGVRVYRPREVDWVKVGGYTGAMPRDGLLTVGSTLIEAPFAWRCRRHEVQLAYGDILEQLAAGAGAGGTSSRICRAPLIIGRDTIYDGVSEAQNGWAVNDSRPAFDAADFMRFGTTLLGQLSHVTNRRGVEYLRALLPAGYRVELLNTTNEHAMHIDATILPLRRGLLVYNPQRVTEAALRRHAVLDGWDLRAYPFTPAAPAGAPPLYMCSPWLVLNALSIDERRIIVTEGDTQFADWLRDELDMDPIPLPFRHVNSIGGSFHCATVDLVRERT